MKTKIHLSLTFWPTFTQKNFLHMKNKFLLPTILLLVLCVQVFAQSTPTALPPFLRDSLDTYVNRALTMWRIPGVAVGVV